MIGQDTVAVSDETGTQALSIRAGRPKIRRDVPGCGLLRGAVHGDIVDTLSDGTVHDLAWDRGRITGLAPDQIRILRPDDVSVVSRRTNLTRVEGARSYFRLRLGERVAILSAKEPDSIGTTTLVALVIRVHHHRR